MSDGFMGGGLPGGGLLKGVAPVVLLLLAASVAMYQVSAAPLESFPASVSPGASEDLAAVPAEVAEDRVSELLLELPAELMGVQEQIEEVDPLRMSVEMTRYLVQRVKPNLERTGRFEHLMDAVFGSKGLKISYGNIRTKSAIETFEDRSGNCLSFTFLFVSMSRHVGIPAYFQEVEEVLSWDRRGDVLVSNRHMFARVELNNARIDVDFLPGVEKSYRTVRRIDDRRAVAHFYNNRGVEALAQGDLHSAMGYFQRSLDTDDEMAATWANRGVALRRLGYSEHAEASYLHALALKDDEPTAQANLAALMLHQGRSAEARPLLLAIAEHRRRNPFHHFRIGAAAAAAGDYREALTHYRTAIRRDPDHALFYIAQGEALEALDDVVGANVAYEQALERSDNAEQRDRLRATLKRVNASGAAETPLQGVEGAAPKI